ncbi:MAG TPA: primosomal protein N' [Methylomirabilota bacterium]|nr:primosomal protein N' [Methylomirabilota bacterium]
MIARVTLDIALRRDFDYLIPDELVGKVEVGSRVKVPFGPREVLGAVTALVEESPHTNLRYITKVLGSRPQVTPNVLKLARWISDYYCAPLETTLRTVLPDSVRKEKEGWREQLFVRRTVPPGEMPSLTKRQREIYEFLDGKPPMPLTHLLEELHTTSATLRQMEEKHLVSINREITERDPYAEETILPTQPLPLNDDQARAFAAIRAAIDSNHAAAAAPVFLIHGVTGSGKTEVYLQSIAHALDRGKGAIVLVPEISLTPQTVERFKARFSAGPQRTLVAVLHSHLSAGERHDEWQKIRQGRARIVIGARSAIFAPVDPLGLIIVDEEHEHSYKQDETPRYNARDVAVMRGHLEKAVVALGSATPSIESFHNAQRGKYQILDMPTRADDKKMPIMRVVDLRHETRKTKGAGIAVLSVQLKEALLQRLERSEQSILFLNRRGFASSLQCPKCGHVCGCPNCSISLTYHRHAQELRCHICGHSENAPVVCPEPKCKNPAIRYAGIGTERVEALLKQELPHARLARMDSDTLKRKEDYRTILGDFRTGKIDILVGTQMIAKGLHFPNVTLVGIIYADLSLHQPDFRAGERTFQLLTQVAGRAGRGDIEGEVFVQAFSPFHPAIQYARRHDYQGFVEQELEFRQQLCYPPFARIALLTLKGRNDEKVSLSADYLKGEVQKATQEIKDLIIAGPAPSPLVRAEQFYRHQIMLRTLHTPKLAKILTELRPKLQLPEDVTLIIDIDPVNLS